MDSSAPTTKGKEKKKENPWIIHSTGITHASELVCLQSIYHFSCRGRSTVISSSKNWKWLFIKIPIQSYSLEDSLWSNFLCRSACTSGSLYFHNRDVWREDLFSFAFHGVGLSSAHTECTAVPAVFIQLFSLSASSPLVLSWTGPHIWIAQQLDSSNKARLSLFSI